MTGTATIAPAAEQLALLEGDGTLPTQFRLDQRTRERGLAHVAALRAQITARAAARQASPVVQAA